MEHVNKLLDADEDLQALFKAVGFVVIQFGQAEQSLDLIVASIFQGTEKSDRPKRIPKMLEPTLNYLRESIDKFDVLAGAKDRILLLAEDFERMSGLRNDIIHGAIADVSPHEGAFAFAKLDIHHGFHHVREFHLDLKKFPELADQLIELGSRAAEIGWEVH